MKISKRQGIWLVLAILFSLFFLNFASAQTCYCASCADCNANLSDPACTEVRLTADISNFSGTCINNPSGFNNKIFDCQGHVIDGDSNGTDYGIYLNGKQNNTIKNCVITDFYSGIYLYQSSNNNTIINLTSNSNIPYGVYLSSSSNNQIINSNLINSLYDFYIDSTSDLGCNNRLENVTGTDNKPIVYYNETINIDGWNNNFTELVLCNADYSTINNVTLTHISKKNNGILLVRTDYSNLTNVFVNNSYHGIFLYSSSNNNQIINSTSNSNTHSGILLFLNSNNNKIINSTSNSNGHSGIFLYSNSNNNQIINSTSNSNPGTGIYLSSSSNNTIINSISNSNSYYGVYLYSSSNNNTIINSTFNSNSYYGIYLHSNVNNNQIINSSLMDNIMYDFYIYPLSDSDCNNRLENVIGTDNKPIVYYNETTNINGWNNNFTELFLCNADYSTINNVNLTHISRKNNGILIFRTDYSNLTNIFINNSYYGIFLYSSFNNQIINLTSNSNFYYGIFLVSSSNNTIINSTSNSNSQRGTYLYLNSNNNQIINLTSNSSSYGIYLHSVSNNTIHSSIIANNTQYGIYIYSSGSTPNIIYNNFFNNTNNFGFEGTIYANNWNTTKTPGINIVGGPYIGGNYWALPNGTGFSQTCTDADEDGICDNAYNLTTNNVDYLPLKYISPCVIIFSNIKPTNNSLFELPQVNFSCEIYNSGSRRASCAINIAGLEVNNSANENIVNYLENLSALDYNFSHKEIFNYSDVYSFSCIAKNKINQTFTSEPYKIRIFINYEKLFNIKMIYAIILFIILSIAFIFFYLSMHYKEQTPIATGFLFLGFIFLIADLIGGIITLKEIGALTEALSGFLSVVTYAVGIIFVLLFMIVLIFGIVRAIKLTKKKKIREWGLLLDDEE